MIKIILVITALIIVLGGGGAYYELSYQPRQYEKQLFEILKNTLEAHPAAFNLEPISGFINPGALQLAELKEQKAAAVDLNARLIALRPPRFDRNMRQTHKELLQSLEDYIVHAIPMYEKTARSFAIQEDFRLALSKLGLLHPSDELTVYNEYVTKIKNAGEIFFNQSPSSLAEDQLQEFEILRTSWNKIKTGLNLIAIPRPGATIRDVALQSAKNTREQVATFSKLMDERFSRGNSGSSLQSALSITLVGLTPPIRTPFGEKYKNLYEELQKKYHLKEESRKRLEEQSSAPSVIEQAVPAQESELQRRQDW